MKARVLCFMAYVPIIIEMLFDKMGKNTGNLSLRKKLKCGFRHIKFELFIRH